MLRFQISFMCHFFIPMCCHRLSRANYQPFLVAWPAHNLLITLPASHQPFCFSLSTLSPLSQFTCFTHIHTFFSLNFSEYVSFCFMFHVPHLLARLSGAIQHIFSCLAGAQYTDCNTCLPSTYFIWVCTNHLNFASSLTSEFAHVYMYCIPNVSRLSTLACLHRPSRVTIEHHPKGSAPPS